MKTKLHLLVISLLLVTGIHQAAAQGTTAFTYQGQLHDNGTNANGTYTMIFALYDSVNGGNQIGSPITNTPTLVNGLFTVNLDFSGSAFTNTPRWLDITISNGVAQTLSPRVQVLPTPYAIYATTAGTAGSAGTASFATTATTAGTASTANIASIANTANSVAANSISTASLQDGAVTAAKIASGVLTSQFLSSNSVATTNIQDGAVTNPKLATNAVATTNIQNGAITSAQIALNAVNTTNIQNGAITDPKIAGTTSLLFGSENNLRVVRGAVTFSNGVAVIVGGSGFIIASNYPPGTGGTLFGYYTWIYQNGDYYLTQSSGIVGAVNPGDWVLISDGTHEEMTQVQSVNNNVGNTLTFNLETYGTGCGTLTLGHPVAVLKNPRLATEWHIAFTPPFSSPPVITLSSDGGSPGLTTTGSPSWVALNRQMADGGTIFEADVGYNYLLQQNGSVTPLNSFPGGCYPWGDGFEFIAIGPK